MIRDFGGRGARLGDIGWHGSGGCEAQQRSAVDRGSRKCAALLCVFALRFFRSWGTAGLFIGLACRVGDVCGFSDSRFYVGCSTYVCPHIGILPIIGELG